MGALAWVTGVIITIGFGLAGLSKLTWQTQMQEAAAHLGFAKRDFQTIGAAELLGAVGTLLGTAVRDLEFAGIGAATGLALLGAGAFMTHRRAGDPPAAGMPAGVLTVLAVLCVIGLTLR